ncbi:MAG: tetratricopeptide repeat protein [Terracidiphilus sp.]|nr:tetratricopeptide repeat protein [Terracidiphilus sp.]MDR3776844.1 tetratricopeptide repeat protein [Terracidiphilus sp.]
MKILLNLGILILMAIGQPGALLAGQARQLSAPHGGNSEEEQLRQIQQLVQSGHLDEARGQVELLLKSQPGDERLYIFMGVIDAQEKDFAGAESSFLRAIQIAPRLTAAYLNIGRLYQEHAAVDPHAQEKALHIYEQLLTFDPNNVEGNYQAAWLSNRLGAFAASQRYLDRLPVETQELAQAMALRCANYVATGNARQAEITAQNLLAHGDLSAEDLFPVLAALSGHKADDVAVHFLESIVQRGLASVEAKQLLADLYESRGRYKDAQKLLEQVLQTAPSSGQILFQMARVAYREGDREGALGFLAHARELEPGNAATHFFFGMICVELNLLPDAKKSLEEAVRLSPTDPYYNYALGSVLVQANELDEAIRCFKKLQEIKPEEARARFALGVAYFYSSRYDEARLELQAIANRPETKVGAQLFLGRIDLKARNFDEAMKHLQASIEADPSVSEAYTDLGLIYLERKDYALAEKTLDQAIKITPDNYLSNQRLLTLYLRTKDPRADAQSQRVEQIRKAGQEREQLLMRTLEIRPY